VVKSEFLVIKRHLEDLEVVKDPGTLGLDLPIKSLVSIPRARPIEGKSKASEYG